MIYKLILFLCREFKDTFAVVRLSRFQHNGRPVGFVGAVGVVLCFEAGFGASYLARVVGQKKAREIWFLCRKYNAQEALDMGLVNKVVPLEQLEDEYVQWAEEMMLLSPLALRMIKAGLNAELDGQAGIQELAGDATLLYYLTDEAQEGKNAFLEKRKPNFKQYPKFP